MPNPLPNANGETNNILSGWIKLISDYVLCIKSKQHKQSLPIIVEYTVK